MIDGKNIYLGQGDVKLTSMRCDYKGVMTIKSQSRYFIGELAETPDTAEECMEESDFNIIIDDLAGAEVFLGKFLEVMLFHEEKDDDASLFEDCGVNCKAIMQAFMTRYEFH